MGEGTLRRDLKQPASALSQSERWEGKWFPVRAVPRTWPETWSSTPAAVSLQTRDLPQEPKRGKERGQGKTRAEGQRKGE